MADYKKLEHSFLEKRLYILTSLAINYSTQRNTKAVVKPAMQCFEARPHIIKIPNNE